MRRLLLLLVPIAVIAGWSTIGDPAEGRWLIRTLVPGGQMALHYRPEIRYPLGSRVARFDSGRPEAAPEVLSEGLAAAGGARLSADAERLLFVGKETADAAYSVWICDPDGGGRRRAVDTATDCGAADFLPDGRIVYSAAIGPGPGGSRWALYVAAGDGSPGRRITWAEGLEVDPAVLQDGRVVYSRWLPAGDGRPAPGAFALFTVHPDGSGAAPLHGVRDGTPAKLMPRQAEDGDLLYAGGELGGTARVFRVDRRAPACAAVVEQGGSVDPALRVAPVPRPQGHLSSVDPDGDRGTLLCIDARTASGEGHAVRLRDGDDAVLGRVELEGDGSFFVELPADRPLLLDLLDERGRVLHAGQAPFWVRPGEVRCCVGCHEDPESSPPNRRPLAVLKDPVPLDLPPPPESGR